MNLWHMKIFEILCNFPIGRKRTFCFECMLNDSNKCICARLQSYHAFNIKFHEIASLTFALYTRFLLVYLFDNIRDMNSLDIHLNWFHQNQWIFISNTFPSHMIRRSELYSNEMARKKLTNRVREKYEIVFPCIHKSIEPYSVLQIWMSFYFPLQS